MKHSKQFIYITMLLLAFTSSCQKSSSDGNESDTVTEAESDTGNGLDSNTDISTDSKKDTDSSVDNGTDSESETSTDIIDCVSLNGTGWAYNPAAHTCKDCSFKECPKDMSVGVASTTTLSGACVCKTKPGYFYSDTTYLPASCDEDNDGWMTIIAREFVESDDPVLKENARCDVREVTSFILHSDDLIPPKTGEEHVAPIVVSVESLPLYEPNNRDAPSLLATDTLRAPAYGDSGRFLQAGELNSLTKACVGTTADYNSNEVADVAEYPDAGGMNSLFAVYSRFAYFIELYRGWFDPADNSYHIQERFRDSTEDPDRSIRLINTKYQRFCRRWTDPLYEADTFEIGMDFAEFFDKDLDYGLGHHSQFKCLQVVVSKDLDAALPYKVTATQAASEFTMEQCIPEVDPLTLETLPNPIEPSLTCTPLESPAIGDVGFGVVAYSPHYSRNEYNGGCANQCLADVDEYDVWTDLPSCPGYNTKPEAYDCEPDNTNFGKAGCGCTGNYTNPPACDVCEGNFDISSSCTTCLNNDTDGHFTGDHCDQCTGNFDLASGCLDCLYNSDDGFWISNTCDHCEDNYDIKSQCTSCLYDDNNGYWDIEQNCTVCANSYSTLKGGKSCTYCPFPWDPDQDCAVCFSNSNEGYWTGDDCGTCQTNFFPGSFDSGNIMIQGDGETKQITSWAKSSFNLIINPKLSINENAAYIHSGIASLHVERSFSPLTPEYASFSTLINLNDYAALISSADFENLEINLQGWLFDQSNGLAPARILFELLDEWETSLGSISQNSSGAQWISLQTTAPIHPDSRYIKVTIGSRDKVSASSFSAFFDDITISIYNQEDKEPRPCTICDQGWQDDPLEDGDDCLLCETDGMTNGEHWDNSKGNCYKCLDDNTNGHWTLPDCSTCKALWSGTNCAMCTNTDYVKDTNGQCVWTKNLLTNPSAGGDILPATASTDGWGISVGTELEADNEASGFTSSDDGYFFRFKDAGGLYYPTAWQRINVEGLSDTVTRDNVKLYFSAKLGVQNSSADKSIFKVYQSKVISDQNESSILSTDILCGEVSTTSQLWVTKTGSCDSLEGVKQLLVQFIAYNPDKNSANAYFDDMNVYYGVKSK